MTHEENISAAKKRVEKIGESQLLRARSGKRESMCPRCGGRMRYPLVENHISRTAPAFICLDCWVDELPVPGMRFDKHQLKITEWWCNDGGQGM